MTGADGRGGRAGTGGRTPTPDAGPSGPARGSGSLQRSGSLRLRGEAARDAAPTLRRERTADSLRPRRARPCRGAAGPAAAEPAARGACSLPPSPAPSRRSSAADSWETQVVLGTSSPFSTESIARNGTTFSSRFNKYVVHCAKKVDDEHYLTPTQRSTRDLRRLRGLLDKAHDTIRQKDAEIHRLTQEVIVLRLRASASHAHADTPAVAAGVNHLDGDPDRKSSGDHGGDPSVRDVPAVSSDSTGRSLEGGTAGADTVRIALPLPAVCDSDNADGAPSPAAGSMAADDGPPLLPSVCDSGNFDCLTSPSVSSKESGEKPAALELEERLGDDWEASEHWIEWEEKRLRDENERRIAELNRQHAAEYQEMKEKYNDKVEGLLQKLTEANGRYFELRPLYDASRLRVGQLELQLEALRSLVERRQATDRSTQTPPQPLQVSAHSQTAPLPVQVTAQSQTAPQAVQVAAQSQTSPQPAQVAAQSQTTPQPGQVAASSEPETQFAEIVRQPQTTLQPTLVTKLLESVAQSAQVAAQSQTVPEAAGQPGTGAQLGELPGPQPLTGTDSAQVAALLERLEQTEHELDRIRTLYCHQLTVLEDSRFGHSNDSSLEMDPPMRLQFLKSAVFHYLTDKDDYAGHMRAISAVLQFSEWERQEVERARARKLSHS